jgi:hypothetical protein
LSRTVPTKVNICHEPYWRNLILIFVMNCTDES